MAIEHRLGRATNWSLLKGLLVSVLLMLPSLAMAQTLPPPPVPYNVDALNVNLVTGKPIIASGGLSIGPADHHGLQLSRQWVSYGGVGGWRFTQLPTITGSTSSPTVAISGGSVPFTGSMSSYSPVFPDGSTLTYSGGTYTFTGSDGTRVTFNTTSGIAGSMSGAPDLALANQITYPDGTVWTFNWQSATYINGYNYTCVPPYGCYPTSPTYGTVLRLASITNSVGYQITLTYDSNDGSNPSAAWFRAATARAINNAVEYCDPMSTTCSFSGTWPQMTYGTSGDGIFTPSSFTDPVGRTTTITYTGYGVQAIRPPGASSNTVVYDYDGSGIVTAVHVAGSVWGYSYTTSSTTITDPASNATTYNFNGSYQVTSMAAGGQTTYYSYCTGGAGCPVGLLQTTTMPEGNSVSNYYDTRGNVLTTTRTPKSGSGLSNIVTSATYPSSCADPRYCNKPTSTTDALGNVTNYNYDTSGSLGTGNLLSVVAPAASGSSNRPITVTSYTNKQAYYKNSGGSIVASGVNISMPTQVSTCQTTGASSGTTTTLPCSSTDEIRATVDYGPQTSGTANNLNPVGGTTSRGDGAMSATSVVTYDNYGRPVTSDGPLSNDTSMIRYNLAGQVTGKIAPDPDDSDSSKFPATRYSYDSWGHAYLVEGGTVNSLSDSDWSAFSQVQNTLTEYDANGRPNRVKVRDSSNNVYQVVDTVYDSTTGRVQCTRVRMDLGNLGSATDGCSTIQTGGSNGPDRVTYNTYDALGRVSMVTSGYGVSGVAANDQTFTFTNNGLLATRKDAENNLTTYIYDGHDRLSQTFFPHPTKGSNASATCGSGQPCDYEQVAYDANGNVTSFRTRRGETMDMFYDNLNRLYAKVVPERSGLPSTYTRDVYYGYDLLGKMTYARFDGSSSGNEGVTNTYDGLGRLSTSTLLMDSAGRQLVYDYDAGNNFARLTYPDGNYIDYWRYSTGMFSWAWLNGSSALFAPRLDAQGRLSWLGRVNTSTSNWTEATGIGYDAISRVSSLATDPGGTTYDSTTTFTYNPAGQIASRANTNDNFAWTGAANVNRSYTSNGLNQYSAVGGTSFSYDANGNLTSDGTNTYIYDVENRLVSRSGGASATMRYDPLGRLYETVGSSTTRFLYDGSNLVAEYDGSGNLLRRYVHGVGVDEPLVQFEGSGVSNSARRYLYADERGSVIAVTDNVGAVLNRTGYDEYGLFSDSNGSYASRFKYTGQIYIPEMGMYYYKARMYSPTLGRFMQTDPIGYGDGANMYNYVRSDPVNGKDPTGLAVMLDSLGNQYRWACAGFEGSPNCGWVSDHKVDGGQFSSWVGRGSSPGNGGVPGLCADWTASQLQACGGTLAFPADTKQPPEFFMGCTGGCHGTVDTSRGTRLAVNLAALVAVPWAVATPYGIATQELSAEALLAREAVLGGATLYRGGVLGRSAAAEGQFWALESPFSAGFAARYGIPAENMGFDFVESATLNLGTRFVTRAAPGIGNAGGGAIEVVTPSGGVTLTGFTMP